MVRLGPSLRAPQPNHDGGSHACPPSSARPVHASHAQRDGLGHPCRANRLRARSQPGAVPRPSRHHLPGVGLPHARDRRAGRLLPPAERDRHAFGVRERGCALAPAVRGNQGRVVPGAARPVPQLRDPECGRTALLPEDGVRADDAALPLHHILHHGGRESARRRRDHGRAGPARARQGPGLGAPDRRHLPLHLPAVRSGQPHREGPPAIRSRGRERGDHRDELRRRPVLRAAAAGGSRGLRRGRHPGQLGQRPRRAQPQPVRLRRRRHRRRLRHLQDLRPGSHAGARALRHGSERRLQPSPAGGDAAPVQRAVLRHAVGGPGFPRHGLVRPGSPGRGRGPRG